MPQISYISIKDIIKEDRMEAEFFCMTSKLTSNFIYGKDIIKKVQYWTSDSLNEEKIWYPILRLNEFDWLFIWEPSKYCDLINEKQYKEIQLKKWDVLICRTNWSKEFVGRSAIVMEDQEIWFASYLFRLQPNEKINSETLLVYLNTVPWKQEILKYKMVSNQANFSPAKFNKIKIPNINIDIQQKVSEIVQTAYDKKQKSKQLYQEAEDLLLTELWLKNHTVSHTLTFSTTKKEIDNTWRYDADYFQPKYDKLIEKIENYKWGWDYVENYIKVQDKNFIPEEWKLYKYIALANVSAQWFISDCEENYWKELPTRARRLVKEWNVIVSSIEWSLSSCAVIEKEFNWALCSNGFYVLHSDYFNSECLLVLFKSNIIQTLLKKWCSWTILTAISKDELNKIQIPLIDQKIQKEISDKIKESFKLRNESKQLLEQAKKMVEDEKE